MGNNSASPNCSVLVLGNNKGSDQQQSVNPLSDGQFFTVPPSTPTDRISQPSVTGLRLFLSAGPGSSCCYCFSWVDSIGQFTHLCCLINFFKVFSWLVLKSCFIMCLNMGSAPLTCCSSSLFNKLNTFGFLAV